MSNSVLVRLCSKKEDAESEDEADTKVKAADMDEDFRAGDADETNEA